jgi:3-phenylpropionate/trans-cinnamate dioxygenase alpha subunit
MGPYNWKFPADNFAGDGYHVPIAHSSAVAAGFGGAGRAGSVGREAQELNRVSNSSEAVNAYYRKHLPELEQRVGKERAQQVTGGVLTVFPNLSLNFGRQLVHVWHPRGPLKTEVWAYCIVDKDAPPEVKEAMYWWNRECFGPSGNLEQDDMNNWLGGSETAKSRIAQSVPMNLSMGLGHEPTPPFQRLQRGTFEGTNENRIRAFYARWDEIMNASSWDQVHINGIQQR